MWRCLRRFVIEWLAFMEAMLGAKEFVFCCGLVTLHYNVKAGRCIHFICHWYWWWRHVFGWLACWLDGWMPVLQILVDHDVVDSSICYSLYMVKHWFGLSLGTHTYWLVDKICRLLHAALWCTHITCYGIHMPATTKAANAIASHVM